MAPEVGLNQPYNLKADVYSWSMVFWYIMSLEPPLAIYDQQMLVHHVYLGGQRPYIREKWNKAISSLLQNTWHPNIHHRLNFKQIIRILRSEITLLDPKLAIMNTFENNNGSNDFVTLQQTSTDNFPNRSAIDPSPQQVTCPGTDTIES
jgi:Protein tyrosine and serine/threonine kinase